MALTVRRWGTGYAVFDGRRRVSGPTRRADAEAARDRLEREATSRVRACLCCGAPFVSEGPHNRLCTACRSLDPGPVAMAFARPRRRREAARA
jgi:hypothetical protein